jgi:hypothetical protein
MSLDGPKGRSTESPPFRGTTCLAKTYQSAPYQTCQSSCKDCDLPSLIFSQDTGSTGGSCSRRAQVSPLGAVAGHRQTLQFRQPSREKHAVSAMVPWNDTSPWSCSFNLVGRHAYSKKQRSHFCINHHSPSVETNTTLYFTAMSMPCLLGLSAYGCLHGQRLAPHVAALCQGESSAL